MRFPYVILTAADSEYLKESDIMRWKLVLLAPLSAAILGMALWASLVIAVFGSAWNMARDERLLIASAFIPIGVAIFAGIFVYRHTARKRRTQAIVTVLLSLLLTPVAYLAAEAIFHARLYIPKTYEVRHAR